MIGSFSENSESLVSYVTYFADVLERTVEVKIPVEEVAGEGAVLFEDEVLSGLKLLVMPLPLRVVAWHA